MKMDKRKTWISWAAWLVIILILAKVMNSGSVTAVTVEENGLSFAAESGYTSSLKWDEVKSVEKRDVLDYGTLVEGSDTAKEKSGIWNNEEFGNYELFVSPKISGCIVCTLQSDQVIVLNYESEESTDSFYEAILEKLEKLEK